MNSRQFKLHIAALLERKRQEEARAEQPKQPAAPRTKRTPTAAKPAEPKPKTEPVEKKPPAAERYEPKITFRIRRSR